MSRLTDRKLVTFPVELRDINYSERIESPPDLFGKTEVAWQQRPIDRFKAVVDIERGHVFSVVTENYELVTNERALKLGEECFQVLFQTADTEGMQIYKITMPSTRSFCHVDLIHRDFRIDVWEQDSWLPYVRVTNSYNRTKPLTYDLGFVRSACSNGMIFEQQTVTVKFYHSAKRVAFADDFREKFGALKKLEQEFFEYMHNLKRFYVPRNVVVPLVCRAFDLQFALRKERTDRQKGFMESFEKGVADLISKYFDEMGDNAYAAFNVITDLASRPDVFPAGENMVHSLQKKSGRWAREFAAAVSKRSFSFDNYLGKYAWLVA